MDKRIEKGRKEMKQLEFFDEGKPTNLPCLPAEGIVRFKKKA